MPRAGIFVGIARLVRVAHHHVRNVAVEGVDALDAILAGEFHDRVFPELLPVLICVEPLVAVVPAEVAVDLQRVQQIGHVQPAVAVKGPAARLFRIGPQRGLIQSLRLFADGILVHGGEAVNGKRTYENKQGKEKRERSLLFLHCQITSFKN